MWTEGSISQSQGGGVEAAQGGQQQEDENLLAESLVCRLSGKAAFPRIVIRDVRAQGGGVSANQLWKQFTLSEINNTLLQPLSQDEIAFNRQSTPDLNKLPKFNLMFSPNVVGEASQMLFFDLCNTSDLATSFSIHLPNERYVYNSIISYQNLV